VASRLDARSPARKILVAALLLAWRTAVWIFVSLRLPDGRANWLDLVPGCVLFGGGLTSLHVVGWVYLPAKFAHTS
jgi:hypothetical protein